jgi:hypothetical protein
VLERIFLRVRVEMSLLRLVLRQQQKKMHRQGKQELEMVSVLLTLLILMGIEILKVKVGKQLKF